MINKVARFFEELDRSHRLDELLEISVINHPMYEYVPKIVIPSTISSNELSDKLDDLFSIPNSYSADARRSTMDTLLELKKKFPGLTSDLRGFRVDAVTCLAQLLKQDGENLVVIPDTTRFFYYGTGKEFMELLKGKFQINDIKDIIGHERVREYLSKVVDLSKEYTKMLINYSRETVRGNSDRANEFERVGGLTADYKNKVGGIRKEFGYEK